MNSSLSDAVAVGVAPLLRSSPIKLIIEYSPGQTLILEDDALRMWWQEYLTMWMSYTQLQMQLQQAQNGPAYSADSIREAFKKESNTEKKD